MVFSIEPWRFRNSSQACAAGRQEVSRAKKIQWVDFDEELTIWMGFFLNLIDYRQKTVK